MSNSWWLWCAVVWFMFLVPPLGYGWGYRGWGTPYPRFIQRRRANAASALPPIDPPVNHHAWGGTGDFVWTMLGFGMFWLFLATWFR